VLLKDTFFKPLEELYENLTARKGKPNLKDLESLILSICRSFGRSYIIIDALDECSPGERKLLLTTIRNLQKASIKIFVTSRQHAQDVERAFSGHVRVEIQATEKDIRAYIEHQIEDDEDLMDLLTEDLRARIVSTIAARAGGM
jgi:NACHT domain